MLVNMIRLLLLIGGLLIVFPLLWAGDDNDRLHFNQSRNERESQLQKSFPVQTSAKPVLLGGVSVPYDFPYIEPTILKAGIEKGRLFLNNWGGTPYVLILNNDGSPYFYQRVENRSRDFKLQPNGM